MRKIILIIVLLLVVGVGIFFWWKYFFVFGEGVKSGHLNYVVLKGDVWKTYEGKLIQEVIRPGIQSYEFEFSIVKNGLEEKIMANRGKIFDLHYKEYHGTVTCRGNTWYIVDSIVSMK
jgi:hypothetical protein